jgi:hypothetical protein
MYIYGRLRQGYEWSLSRYAFLVVVLIAACMMLVSVPASAQQTLPPGFTPLTTENPKANSFGMEGRISSPPPSVGARITVPSTGQTFAQPIITVSGICPNGVLVEILNNGVMVGSTFCENGSFSLQILLFIGKNDLTARVLDDLGQEGPPSNMVSVTYNRPGANFSPFVDAITLTSEYSRRAADPGSMLVWPLQLSGGTGPYAFSIDWGDGTDPQLQSQSVAGIVNIQHVYKNPGIYRVTIRVVDSNGVVGFLQVIAVANGDAASAIVNTAEPADRIIIQRQVVWLPAAVVTALLIPAFWLGRRNEARAIRKRLEHDAEMVRELDN